MTEGSAPLHPIWHRMGCAVQTAASQPQQGPSTGFNTMLKCSSRAGQLSVISSLHCAAGISQLLDFLQSGNTPKRTVTRSKSKPKTQLAPPGRAAAARQQAAGKTAGTGPARTSSSNSGGGGAAAAAAAAAVMRASGGGSSSGGAQQQQVRGLWQVLTGLSVLGLLL